MKRFLLSALLALSLAGCATIGQFLDPNGVSVLVGGKSIIANVASPVGPEQMAVVDGAYRTAVVSAENYRKFCYSQPIAQLPTICNNRRQVVRIFQSAYRRAQPIMVDLRAFVRANDQVSAKSVLIAAGQAISDMETAVAKYAAQ